MKTYFTKLIFCLSFCAAILSCAHIPASHTAPVGNALAQEKAYQLSARDSIWRANSHSDPTGREHLAAADHALGKSLEQNDIATTENDLEAKAFAQAKAFGEKWHNCIGAKIQRFLTASWWLLLIGSVALGVLAAIGNYFPGWWSLPALAVIKLARFIIFAGIPHLVDGIVYLFKAVFRKRLGPSS